MHISKLSHRYVQITREVISIRRGVAATVKLPYYIIDFYSYGLCCVAVDMVRFGIGVKAKKTA